jgi:hypothetical protein
VRLDHLLSKEHLAQSSERLLLRPSSLVEHWLFGRMVVTGQLVQLRKELERGRDRQSAEHAVGS